MIHQTCIKHDSSNMIPNAGTHMLHARLSCCHCYGARKALMLSLLQRTQGSRVVIFTTHARFSCHHCYSACKALVSSLLRRRQGSCVIVATAHARLLCHRCYGARKALVSSLLQRTQGPRVVIPTAQFCRGKKTDENSLHMKEEETC